MIEAMPDNTPDTGQQRRALEEMSQSLLQSLDAMVAEQEARAAEFAQRTHSLSPLPKSPAPVAEMEPQPLQVERPRCVQAPPAKKVPPPPMRAAQAPSASPAPEKRAYAEPVKWQEPRSLRPVKQEEENSRFVTGVIVFILATLSFIIRACS